MCTLIAAVKTVPGFPLVVTANRDERLDRPASPPALWAAPRRFLAPKDERAQGTWLGLNEAGLFVGITNRFGAAADGSRQSRGRLVVEALRAEGAWALHQSLASLPVERFNPFHLFYADAASAFVTWSDGARLRQKALGPGLHIVTERSLGGDDRARTELIRERWQTLPQPPSVAQLHGLLSEHGAQDPLGGTCIHAPALNYGTRSSMVLLLAEALSESRFFWSEGPPCKATLEDLTPALVPLTTA